MKKIKLGIVGASGKMGKSLIAQLKKSKFKDFQLIRKISSIEKINEALDCDLIIDFSSPKVIDKYNFFLIKKKLPAFVVGTTGLNPKQFNILKKLSKKTAVLYSSNFSVGIYLFHSIIKEYANRFLSLNYSAHLDETHHIHKKDKPSGTAISLAQTFKNKTKHSIKIISHRKGTVVGDHHLAFNTKFDEFRVSHFAKNRSLFAEGALFAAQWTYKMLKKNKKGYFSLSDFLDERTNSQWIQ